MKKTIDFEKITLRKEITTRGGGLEIDLTSLGFKGQKMTAYQNYLGGGLLGRIANDCTVKEWKDKPKLVEIAEGVAMYFHSITNPDTEWEGTTFENLQKRPISAY